MMTPASFHLDASSATLIAQWIIPAVFSNWNAISKMRQFLWFETNPDIFYLRFRSWLSITHCVHQSLNDLRLRHAIQYILPWEKIGKRLPSSQRLVCFIGLQNEESCLCLVRIQLRLPIPSGRIQELLRRLICFSCGLQYFVVTGLREMVFNDSAMLQTETMRLNFMQYFYGPGDRSTLTQGKETSQKIFS